jgi:phage repressor protein C with HTH and peptisase S24 domain
MLQRDLPVFGTALGADLEFVSLDGHPVAIEQTTLNSADRIDQIRRLPALQDEREAFAVYVQGSSMSPRYEDGELALVAPKRAVRPGDYVLVQLKRPLGEEQEEFASALVKRLIRRSGSYIELEQFNPPAKFKVEAERVDSVYHIMSWSEAAGL